ncbi:cold-shock protein [Rhodovibrionaceae bacterium A322]
MSDVTGFGDSLKQAKGTIKWFNTSKGFGFVHFENGDPDAFLHVSVLEQIGRVDLPEGAIVEVSVSEGRKGLQVQEIVNIVSMPEVNAIIDDGEQIDGTVKFFNEEKGFGFIVPDDGSSDVFVSSRILQRAEIQALEPEQRVRVSTKMGQKGPMAESVEVLG